MSEPVKKNPVFLKNGVGPRKIPKNALYAPNWPIFTGFIIKSTSMEQVLTGKIRPIAPFFMRFLAACRKMKIMGKNSNIGNQCTMKSMKDMKSSEKF